MKSCLKSFKDLQKTSILSVKEIPLVFVTPPLLLSFFVVHVFRITKANTRDTQKNKQKRKIRNKLNYAHIEVLVTFLLVNFFGFLVITRDHGSFEVRHYVEILPTGLPELSKPSRDLLELKKAKFLEVKILNFPRKI